MFLFLSLPLAALRLGESVVAPDSPAAVNAAKRTSAFFLVVAFRVEALLGIPTLPHHETNLAGRAADGRMEK